ncbi:MAG: hypothetical protein ABIO94_00980, partial [Opitutaceae bacterium]
DASEVAEVRRIVHSVDWCEVHVVERPKNLGLGRNVLSGVTHVAEQYPAFVVWEDDLICVRGTYAWMCAALLTYADDPRVMSVSGWTHPRVTPSGTGEVSYFDVRAESWSWGAWSRSWRGMLDETALEKMAAVKGRGIDPATCGSDLPAQARDELPRNLWAARWLYHHLLHDGLCLRPPWSMVDHQGFDASATNAPVASGWEHRLLRAAPPVPTNWPSPVETSGCRQLWRAAYPSRPKRWLQRVRAKIFPN